jgi:peptide/nickel transport system permease protein
VSTYVAPVRARVLSRVGGRLAGRDWIVIACVIVIAVVVLITLLAPVLSPYSPTAINLLEPSQGPSSAHLLGTDDTGRDILSRVIYGGRASLLGAFLIVTASSVVGVALALSSAWMGGVFDTTVSRMLDIMFAIPGLLLAILAVAMFGPGLVAPVIALAISYTPYMARLLRGAAIRERSLPYVAASSAQGFSGWRVAIRHVLPNVMPVVIVQATLSIGYAIIDLASLSFLGLGVQPPAADWGSMVATGEQDILAHHPEQSLFASLMILITVLAFVVLGERLSSSSSQVQVPH